ncbi:hypothetical protein CLV30_101449 [Haloactinopolyspora alba]|uniref:Uncharacterized protein n=1 Tax=Haloactinopolyspora alba TaxID=648780 RepID=A0A2P8EG76_9ACTN|nr:hypothetical protein [Haloactinopolyspora alba]PSL08477.1 hypothetical protein CLV30_101449 [Haloactinopolyspora alba]
MALDAASGRGELRSAIEGLLRTCVDLERQAYDLGHRARGEVDAVVRELAGLQPPELRGLADEIAGIGARLGTDVTDATTEGRRAYLDEVHHLLTLLAPHHGVDGTLPPLAETTTLIRDADAFAAQFPPGFARRYVRDLITSVDRSVTLTIDDAGRVQPVPTDDVDAATTSIADTFDGPCRAQGAALLTSETSHAIEQHGPQIPDEAHLARLVWLKDPTGQDAWQVSADNRVTTAHWAGTSTGGFTSPEALAKPINAILTAASTRAQNLDQFLDANAEDTRLAIHVPADQADLSPDDATGYRGSGTGHPETQRDWIAARKYAMKNGGPAVHGVPDDPLRSGSDPGAMVVFKHSSDGWRLVTCFPVDAQRTQTKRLEEL